MKQLLDWLDDRTGFREIANDALYEKIPGGARWRYVWGSTLVFGLMHLGNYEALTHPLGLAVVLPQTIGGLLLAYTRTRLGLGAAMAHHAAYNAVFLAGDYGWW